MASPNRRTPARAAANPSSAPTGSARGGRIVVVVGLLAAALGAGWWFLRPRSDRVAETLALQGELLAAGSAAARSRDVERIMRNVDHMTADEVKRVRTALTQEWQKLRREMSGRFSAAQPAEKDDLADADVDRWVTFQRLQEAVNPGARPQRGGRQARPPKAGAGSPGRQPPDAQYVEAVRARAKARGIPHEDFR